MRKYNPANCNNSVRAVIKDGNTTITLIGKHANEWDIIKSFNGTIIVTSYPNRIMARKEWKSIIDNHKKQ